MMLQHLLSRAKQILNNVMIFKNETRSLYIQTPQQNTKTKSTH